LSNGPYLKIMVSDNGKGIPTDILDKIFEPYFSTKPQYQGLGLAASYTIVKRHKGTIIAESKKGKGALFSIYLPANRK